MNTYKIALNYVRMSVFITIQIIGIKIATYYNNT